MVSYKKKCSICKKNYVLTNNSKPFVVCYECQQKEMNKPIKDPEMKKMFDIPEELYKKNSFLCNIKINYLRYGSLTEKQVDAFKRVAKELQDEENKANKTKEEQP